MDRHIPLDGCVNFRDVGGYQVVRARQPAGPWPRLRWRRLFRSDALNDLSAADVALLTGDLRITTVVDLRTGYERQRDARRPLEQTDVEIIHAPLITERNVAAVEKPGLTLAERYVWMLELAGEPLVHAITAVARAPGAVIVHCAAGKDRTGLIIASILGALGVGDEDIVADYALTTDNLEGIEQRLRRRSESYGDRARRGTGRARGSDARGARHPAGQTWLGGRFPASGRSMPARDRRTRDRPRRGAMTRRPPHRSRLPDIARRLLGRFWPPGGGRP